MKKLYFLFLLLIAGTLSYGQVILSDNFNYADNALLTANGWAAHSSAGTEAINVGASNGLTYAGYSGLAGITGADVGNAAYLDNNGEDINRTFTEQTTGDIYYSFLLKVDASSPGYFMHLGDGGASNFTARLFVRADVTDFNLGISNTNTASYAAVPSKFTIGATYLVIIKLGIVSGKMDLWVKSSGTPLDEVSAGAPEHSLTVTPTFTNIKAVYLRQYAVSQRQTIDGLRVATAWPVDGTLGIGKNEIANFSLYPNPVKGGKVFINSDNTFAERSVAIYDVLGKQVVSQKGTQNSIEVSHLNKGVYIIKVAEEGKVATRKLVIE